MISKEEQERHTWNQNHRPVESKDQASPSTSPHRVLEPIESGELGVGLLGVPAEGEEEEVEGIPDDAVMKKRKMG